MILLIYTPPSHHLILTHHHPPTLPPSLAITFPPHTLTHHHLSTLTPSLTQVLSEQMVMSLTSVLDKINSQQFRISQRLQWAAGANPALNTIVDEFERAMNRRKQILQVKQCSPLCVK